MEIVITENQYNRIILTEATETKRLYADKILEFYIYNYDSEKGAFVPEHRDLPYFMGRIQNLTDKPIIFTFNKSNSSGLNRITFGNDKELNGNNLSTLNLGSVIQPFDSALFSFQFAETKKDFFVQNFGVFYTQPPSQPIYKTINIPIYIESWENQCKLAVNQTHLNSAIAWWKNWLKSKSTQQRFANTFGYGLEYVQQIFFQYGKILDQIKMEYTFDKTKDNAGWVRPLLKSGYNIAIVINCAWAMKYSESEKVNLLIHEIQHVLSSYHRFEHPLKDNFFKDFFNFYKDFFTGVLKSEPEGTEFKLDRNSTEYKTLYKFLTSQGFKDNTIYPLLHSYFWRLRNDEEHLKTPNEIRSSLAELRRVLKLNPNQKITKELLINKAEESAVNMFISQWLFSKKPLSEFLNYYNSLAMGKTNTTDRNLA
jgi:hypothetical protein